MVRAWQLSRPLRALAVDLERAPGAQGLTDLGWRDVVADETGLVDVARTHPRSGEPDLVYARTVLRSDRPRTMRLQIGYSDAVSVFLDGRPCFSASSGYGTRDSSFLGIVGLNDTVHLPLGAGDHELVLAVAELSGGWGFMARDADAAFAAPGVEKAWETPRDMRFPESAAWDPGSRAIYVSGYDAFHRSRGEGQQVVSRISADGRVEKIDWLTGLRNPTGLAVSGGRLFVVEPTAIAEIDIARAQVVGRREVPGAVMLNDIAVDAGGVAYVSDSVNGVLYRLSGASVEEWLRGPEVDRPNGVCLLGKRLVWGNNGDGTLRAADLATKATSVLADLGGGLIDGIEPGRDGSLLVSHNEGRLYLVSPSGEVRRLLDTTGPEQNLADFDYVPELDLVVCPGWIRGNLVAYRLDASRPW
jgi:sugar lactone lactonase YvrE